MTTREEKESSHNFLIDVAKEDFDSGKIERSQALATICVAEELESIRQLLQHWAKHFVPVASVP